MKSIVLTEAHKDKLLEMCKVLFPNNTIKFDNMNVLYIGTEREFGHYIHWFEFCMTHLPVELYRYAMHKYNVNPINAFEIISNNLIKFEDFGRYEIDSPIDYLYKEFKKLQTI